MPPDESRRSDSDRPPARRTGGRRGPAAAKAAGSRRGSDSGRPPKRPSKTGRRTGSSRAGRNDRDRERWPDGDPADNPELRKRGWGGVARRGTRQFEAHYDPEEFDPDYGNERPEAEVDPEVRRQREERDAARRVERLRLEKEARRAIERAGPPRAERVPVTLERAVLPSRPRKAEDLDVALTRAMGDARGLRMHKRVLAAADAFAEERYLDALELIKNARDGAPAVAEVRELNGLILYRLGRWKLAAKELEAFRELAGSCEQNPVLCDCYRAMGRWNDVDALWLELREASPDAATVAEGRIVVAGGLADRGRTQDAVRLLEQAWKQPKAPREHHLRTAYALADLYERAGDVPKARALFGWLVRHDAEFADAGDRLRSL